jgi:hypothetical protein
VIVIVDKPNQSFLREMPCTTWGSVKMPPFSEVPTEHSNYLTTSMKPPSTSWSIVPHAPTPLQGYNRTGKNNLTSNHLPIDQKNPTRSFTTATIGSKTAPPKSPISATIWKTAWQWSILGGQRDGRSIKTMLSLPNTPQLDINIVCLGREMLIHNQQQT